MSKKERLLWIGGALVAALPVVLNIQNIVMNVRSMFEDSNSHTSLKFASADDVWIRVVVRNAGKKQSVLLAARIKFQNPSIAAVELSFSDDDKTQGHNVLKPDETVMLKLNTGGVSLRPPDRSRPPYSYEQGLDLVRKEKQIRIELDVQESNDPAGKHHTPYDDFDEARIDQYLAWRPRQ